MTIVEHNWAREYQEKHQRKLEMARVRRLEKKELERKILDFKIPVIECPLGCKPYYLTNSPKECEAIAKQLDLDRRGKWDLEWMTLYRHLNSRHAKEEISNLLCQIVIERDEDRREK